MNLELEGDLAIIRARGGVGMRGCGLEKTTQAKALWQGT